MIRVDALWLAVEPLDMRAGTEAALACIDTSHLDRVLVAYPVEKKRRQRLQYFAEGSRS